MLVVDHVVISILCIFSSPPKISPVLPASLDLTGLIRPSATGHLAYASVGITNHPSQGLIRSFCDEQHAWQNITEYSATNYPTGSVAFLMPSRRGTHPRSAPSFSSSTSWAQLQPRPFGRSYNHGSEDALPFHFCLGKSLGFWS